MTARATLAAAFSALIASATVVAAHDVTVHRGTDVQKAFGPTAPAGATVVARGAGIKPYLTPNETVLAGRMDRSVPIVAGDRLWLIDTAADRLTVCALRGTTEVGREVIRCRHRRLPR